MLMAYLTLFSGLLISGVAIFYSVAGLTSIFSAAVWPIIIMGVSLEVAKLVATVWVKQNWAIAPRLLKGYLVGAVIVLMFITSLGIFGFLSKAHSDQTLVSGDVGAKIAVYDEKIKTAKENIDANRKALKQMDEAVDQVMGRSTDEKGADKAVQIRRSQQKERNRLQSEIASEQKTISQLSEERAPIAAEVRKVEAEVGPIKYIAAFVYGENPDANILEKAVTWVIILIVIVFDPLAVMLLLASQYTFASLRPKEEDIEQTVEEWFAEGKERARQLDEEAAGQAADLPVDSDPPIPSFLLKKNQPEEDLDAINLELAEAAVVPEPIEPEPEQPVIEYKILEDVEEEEFIIETPDTPIDLTKTMEVHIEYIPEDDLVEESNVTITHTPEGMLIEDRAGMQEIPVINNPLAMDERPGDYVEPAKTYVQNEEQQESGVWTQIANKTITEEEYLKAVQQKQKGE